MAGKLRGFFGGLERRKRKLPLAPQKEFSFLIFFFSSLCGKTRCRWKCHFWPRGKIKTMVYDTREIFIRQAWENREFETNPWGHLEKRKHKKSVHSSCLIISRDYKCYKGCTRFSRLQLPFSRIMTLEEEENEWILPLLFPFFPLSLSPSTQFPPCLLPPNFIRGRERRKGGGKLILRFDYWAIHSYGERGLP